MESARRGLSKPVVKKEPVTPCMIWRICEKFSPANANLSDLCVAAMCASAYAGFLRFNELSFLRCCDVKFCNGSYVELFIARSKTDIYRNGNTVLLAKTDNVTCPFCLLTRYVQAANIDLFSDLKIFRSLQFLRSKGSYRLWNTGISHTRTREVHAFSQIDGLG